MVFSPWTDLALTGASVNTRDQDDPLFTRAALAGPASQYLANRNPHAPLASPLFADLTGLPPLLIQVGSYEVLLDDALRLAARAAEHDVDVSLDVVAGRHTSSNRTRVPASSMRRMKRSSAPAVSRMAICETGAVT